VKFKNENPTEFELLGKHQHRWVVVSNRWQCEICGKGIGLGTKDLREQKMVSS
jgi:hypothetical protein